MIFLKFIEIKWTDWIELGLQENYSHGHEREFYFCKEKKNSSNCNWLKEVKNIDKKHVFLLKTVFICMQANV